MNKATLRNLGIVLLALVAVLVGLELADDSDTSATGAPLFDDLRAAINDVDSMTIERADADPVVINRADSGWVVASRDGYPADVAKVREVLLALADAVVLEEKTSNPDLYEALGVRDPGAEGSAGVRLAAEAGDRRYAVIIGKTAQGSNRYARIDGDAQSVLIDKNPGIPADGGGWLDKQLVDIPSRNVRAATIRHADGETISVSRTERGTTDFTVADIPDGRELSYPTVANSIGGALASLSLEDVRRAEGGDPATVSTFTTFDGLTVVVSAYPADDDATWIALEASADTDAPAAAESDTGNADDAGAADDAAAEAAEPAEQSDAINARASGWEFRIPSFKANQLTRRWDDILADEATDADE